jgi:hypothetical protein
MNHHTVWYGTHAEQLALLAAVSHHCTCEFAPLGPRVVTCEPHRMLLEDQRALDGLVFARRFAQRLRAEEGLTA